MKKFVTLLVLIMTSNLTIANELVWKNSEHKNIDQLLNQNPIYKVLRLRRDQRIERNELGSAISPYFKSEKSYYRYYESIGQCFRIDIYETKSLYKKSYCFSDFENIIIKLGDQTARIFTPTKDFPKAIQVSNKSGSFSYLAHVHAFDEIEDLDNLDLYPTQEIEVAVKEMTTLTNTKGYITLNNKIEVSRSKLGYLSQKTEKIEQNFTFDLYNHRDFFFKDENNNIYIYKRYQPTPFTFRFLKTSENYLTYLDKLEALFYPYKNSNRCFRNDWVTSSEHDCDTLIFKNKAIGTWTEMNLIKLDYQRQVIEIL